jgi:transcriptional regulator with XRE-family HTH domain
MQNGIQRAIAKKSNLSETYISLILKGKKRINNWSTAKILANVTGTNCELWLEESAENIRKEISRLKIEDLKSIQN